jgi:hypothetical protein
LSEVQLLGLVFDGVPQVLGHCRPYEEQDPASELVHPLFSIGVNVDLFLFDEPIDFFNPLVRCPLVTDSGPVVSGTAVMHLMKLVIEHDPPELPQDVLVVSV